MKVLFVSSGNRGGISPIIRSQGESLQQNGLEIEYFGIQGKGISGYLSNIRDLKNLIQKTDPDIVHAHYGMAALLAVLVNRKTRLVVSFMGDDILGSRDKSGKITLISKWIAWLNIFMARKYYDHCIVKSLEMHGFLKSQNVSVIPNGVNLNRFMPMNKTHCREKLGWSAKDVLIIFVSDPSRSEKNYQLAEQAVSLVKIDYNVQLIPVVELQHSLLPYVYNAADVMILTSFHEGSPNVIKEAMACNCPIVSTRVGDVEWVVGDTEGCYLADFDPEDFAKKLLLALHFATEKGRTRGRERIIQLGLDSDTVAKKIIGVYKKVLGIEDDVDLEFHRAKGEVEGINQNP